MTDNTKQESTDEQLQQPADERSNLVYSSFLKITDPESGEVLLQQRDE